VDVAFGGAGAGMVTPIWGEASAKEAKAAMRGNMASMLAGLVLLD